MVFHATSHDVQRFQSHGKEAVYRADNEEIAKADPWDMGDDHQGIPDAYHYGALSDALSIGSDEALAMRTRQAEKYPGTPDSQRHLSDLKRLSGKKITQSHETRPNNDGFWFTPDTAYNYIHKAADLGDGANVMPVYLSIQNPVYLDSTAIETAGRSYRMEHYIQKGYDGAIYADDPNNLQKSGFQSCTQIVAFKPNQIKSAIGNSGAYDPMSHHISETDNFN